MGAPQLQPIQRMNAYDLELLEKSIRLQFGDTFTEEAAHKSTKEPGTVKFSQHLAFSNIGYVKEAGTKEIDPKMCFGVRTYKTFMHHAQKDKALFYTPNGLCSRKSYKKDNGHVRWINSIVIDIDEQIEFVDLLKRISKAKLPQPTMINKTPGGGWHVYWILKKRIKGWHKSNQDIYAKIAKAIQVSIGGDPFAKSVSNYFRIPKDIQMYQEENRFTILKFKNWYKKALETNYLVKESSKETLINHSAVLKLKEGVISGARNNAAYALAKIHQYEGYSMAESLNELKEWNKLNDPPISDRDLIKRVNSAFNGDGRIPLNYIYNITGIKINIGRIVAFRNHKKDRSERTNNHFDETLNDLKDYLKEHNSYLGSQAQLAEELKTNTGFDISLRSLKEVIKQLKNGLCSDEIRVEVFGQGRGAKTKISLISGTPKKAKVDETCTPSVPQKCTENGIILDLYPKCTPKSKEKWENAQFVPQMYPKSVNQLEFSMKCGKVCTPFGVQKTKNLKGKSKKMKDEAYSSNKVISMYKATIEKEEETVQAPNNHKEGLVGTALKLSDRTPFESGYQHIHEVHSEKLLAVDAVDPCGYVDNRRAPKKNSMNVIAEEVSNDGDQR